MCRRKVLAKDVTEKLKYIVLDISKEFKVDIIEQKTDQDHVHILFKTNPTVNVTKNINSIKGVSSRKLFQEFPDIKKKLWRCHLLSRSYCL